MSSIDPERTPSRSAALARATPYELVFAQAGTAETAFPEIRRDAEEHGSDESRFDQFVFLPSVGTLVRDVVPPEAPPEALEQYRRLLYQAYNFWRFGERLYLLDAAVARYLVEAAPSLEGWEFAVPYPSLYLQLPANLFWASISPESTPEPVDGFFVSVAPGTDAAGAPFERVELLMVLGIRRDRDGFSVIGFDTEVGPGIAASWMAAPGRERAKDFENVLPGGELSGLYSILTNAEALKLVTRALWYLDQHPADLVPEEGAAPIEDAAPSTALDYLRITLGAPEGAGGAEG
jgi:hypothetical protein